MRAGLAVLVQRNLAVALPGDGPGGSGGWKYVAVPRRARLMARYGRYVDHVRRLVFTGDGMAAVPAGGVLAPLVLRGNVAGMLVERLIVAGRCRSGHVVRYATGRLEEELRAAKELAAEDEAEKAAVVVKREAAMMDKSERVTSTTDPEDVDLESTEEELEAIRVAVVNTFVDLVRYGFVKIVTPLEGHFREAVDATSSEKVSFGKRKIDRDSGETEWDDDDTSSAIPKRQKISASRYASSAPFDSTVYEVNILREHGFESPEIPSHLADGRTYIRLLRKHGLLPEAATHSDPVEIKPHSHSEGLPAGVYDTVLPPGALWSANPEAFHASMRAYSVGRYVHDRYGPGPGAAATKRGAPPLAVAAPIVTAALRFVARREFAGKAVRVRLGRDGRAGGTGPDVPDLPPAEALPPDEAACFHPGDVLGLLPRMVLDLLAGRGRAGEAAADAGAEAEAAGAQTTAAEKQRQSLIAHLLTLSRRPTGPAGPYPAGVSVVEHPRGHPAGGVFEVPYRHIVEYVRGRAVHRAVCDRFGDLAGRLCAILGTRGYLEAEALAEDAMIPVKETQDILNRLYRANIVTMLNIQQTKQHNPLTAVYLWTVDRTRMFSTITNDICAALTNLRLRHRHEMAGGTDFVNRAAEGDDNDGGEAYVQFYKGLERLDNACLQLDETLMLLKDY